MLTLCKLPAVSKPDWLCMLCITILYINSHYYVCSVFEPHKVFLNVLHIRHIYSLAVFMSVITSPTEGDGRLCFRWRRYVGRYICKYIYIILYIYIYVCEQLPGAISGLIVTKRRQSYPLPQRTK